MRRLRQTPSQTVGPFFALGLTPEQYGYDFRSLAGSSVAEGVEGQRIRIEGQVFDGAGAAIGDAVIEFWQADSLGRYARSPDNVRFPGFLRAGTGTDPEHRFRFDTVKPGPVAPGHAPHIGVALFMRGLLTHAYTRIYFADEPEANLADPVLSKVSAARRSTLLATLQHGLDGPHYQFDIHMQGERETVFFDV